MQKVNNLRLTTTAKENRESNVDVVYFLKTSNNKFTNSWQDQGQRVRNENFIAELSRKWRTRNNLQLHTQHSRSHREFH